MNYTLCRVGFDVPAATPPRGVLFSGTVVPFPFSKNRQRPMQRATCAEGSGIAPTLTGPLQDEESMPALTDEIKAFI